MDSPNCEIVAHTPEPKRFAVLDPRFIDQVVKRTGAIVLTDDFAPIDRLVGLDSLIDG